MLSRNLFRSCSLIINKKTSHHHRSIIIPAIQPKVKGFICTNAHPIGCKANVKSQIDYILNQRKENRTIGNTDRIPNVLIIGSSTGYGLASRITTAFKYNANTIGIFFEKPGAGKRTASAGWLNTCAFQEFADEHGLKSYNINGDAFSNEMKFKTIDIINITDFGKIDLLIYSLASPVRLHPETGIVHKSVLKPIGKPFTQIGLNTDKQQLKEFTIECASEEEIADTVHVMGGQDWKTWIQTLEAANVLSSDFHTTAYTYLGDRVTHDIYLNGTIGAAKKDLQNVCRELGSHASISVMKAVVTQASSAIPIMSLYLALLFRVMKNAGTHEGCIEQIDRLFDECLHLKWNDGLFGNVSHFNERNGSIDAEGRNRMDDKEICSEIQSEVESLWKRVTNENLMEISDFEGYRSEFLKLFGFGVFGVDYDADIETEVCIRNLWQCDEKESLSTRI